MKKITLIILAIVLIATTAYTGEQPESQKLQYQAQFYTEQLKRLKAEYELVQLKLQTVQQQLQKKAEDKKNSEDEK